MSLDSPFDHVLGTNYRPSIDEAARITTYLDTPRSELLTVDAAVHEAQDALRVLLSKQAGLQQHIKAHEQLLHPIRRLPDEILQEVFLHSLPTFHLPVLSNLSPPLLLTRVCHHWRVLAHATPALWSSLHIPIPSGRSEWDHHRVTDLRKKGVQHWLGLAKGTPLSISLHWPPLLEDRFWTGNRFPDQVFLLAHHLRELELDLPETHLTTFTEAPPSVYPLLERVIVRLPSPPDQLSRGAGIADGDIWKAPKLVRVVWESVDDDFFRLPLQWGKMKEIDIAADPMITQSVFSPSDARTLVKATPSIETLRLELSRYPQARAPLGFGLPSGEPAPEEEMANPQNYPLMLNHLTTLDITDVYIDPQDGNGFLGNLYLPGLTTLAYRCFGLSPFLPSAPSPDTSPRPHRQRPPTHPLLEFLRAQDKVLLTTWRVVATSLPRDAFIECLRLMPLLEKLHVIDQRLFTSCETNPEPEPLASPVRPRVADAVWMDDDMMGSAFFSGDEQDKDVGHEGEDEEGGAHTGEEWHYEGEPSRQYTSLEDRYHDYLNSVGPGRRPNRYAQKESLKATEVAPDDDLLKSFVPPSVWWRHTSWSGGTEVLGTGRIWRGAGRQDTKSTTSKGKGRSQSPVMEFGRDVGRAESVEIEMGDEGLEVEALVENDSSREEDVDMTISVEEVEQLSDSDSPPTSQGPRFDWSSSPTLSIPFVPPASDLTASPNVQRVSVPIPVDTSDLAAEESEILCPRLTTLGFDRARFTLWGLETFVRARRALSSGVQSKAASRTHPHSTDGKTPVSHRVTLEELENMTKLAQALHDKAQEELNARDFLASHAELEREGSVSGDWESTAFFTAHSSPHPHSDKGGFVALPPVEEVEDSLSGQMTVRDATPTPVPRRASGASCGDEVPDLNLEDVDGTLIVAPTVPVAPLQRLCVELVYNQPYRDIPHHNSPEQSLKTFADSKLSQSLREEYGDVRLALRFADTKRKAALAQGFRNMVDRDRIASSASAHVSGSGGGDSKGVRNDPRDCLRGWSRCRGVSVHEDWGDLEWRI